MTKNKLNGSADLLAKAIQQVFEEATEISRAQVKQDMHGMEQNLSDKIDATNESIKTTSQNMQAQFAQQEEKIAKMVKG